MSGTGPTLFDNDAKREWFTAKELASLNVPIIPETESAVIRFAKRADWQSTTLARKRKGRGGGWEYHIGLLPDVARKALEARFNIERLNATVPVVQVKTPAKTKVTLADADAAQRCAAEARKQILQMVEQLVMRGMAYDKAVCGLTAKVKVLLNQDVLTPDEKHLLELVRTAKDKGTGISRRAIYNWRKAFKESGFAGLIPGKRKQDALNATRYDWAPGFLKFYADPRKPTLALALDQYRASLDEPARAPSYDQVKRYLTKLKKADPIAAYKGREGVLALKARKVYVSRSTEGLEPTDIYTGDGKTFDAFVAHPFSGSPMRPEITSILDVVTRKCVGYSIGLNEKAYDVSEALRNASMANGVAAIFYVDNGKGYKNQLLDEAAVGMLARLGTHKEHSIAYNSQARGIIERFNGSVYTRLAKTLPSYTGRDLDREAALKLHKQIKSDLKETGASDILIGWNEFLKIFDGALQYYNNRPHSGLPQVRGDVTGNTRHMSPNEYWAQFESHGFKAVTLAKDDSDDLSRPAVRRKVTRGLVTIETNRYFALELERYDRREVMVCYDMLDASQVWVRELDYVDGVETPGALICTAKFEGNSQAYFPKPVIENAREKKAKTATKRLEDKLRRVEQEQRPGYLVEHSGEQPMEVFASAPGFEDSAEEDLVSVVMEPVRSAGNVVQLAEPIEAPKSQPQPTTNSGRPRFKSKEELAVWVLDNPEKMTDLDKKILSGCLTDRTYLDLFEALGVDTESLRTLLRAAA
ncbi:Mu transposase C-terminal domain-containing protein [Pseudovibrio sp. Tun.PSC04-5.I4]|uniref:Mu transposase C-terminal domain-containing protein n=1 Tax=Pseudovibrio sp. Tun.PSC04-5.I4 TaxID=1798213 RepID=UPI00088505F9|nr:Mu transposase C-terminal domain-containing protein [Pseudovibrio sp. Tun.PSC04-5.I4]SDQ18050.1 putative transposase [Pseudovibrio sp. Tun.PSC04-5.I4]